MSSFSIVTSHSRNEKGYIYLWHSHHHHHHHHHFVPQARISLTLSRHFSLSFIASGRSSGLHPVFSHSCCIYVRAGRPDFARPYVGVHRSTSLMSSSLLLQLCPACLVRLTCIVFVMGSRWPYSWCLVGCCRQDLFNIARNILGTVKGPNCVLPLIGAHLTPFNFHHLHAGSEITWMSILLHHFQDGSQQISLASKPLSLQPTFCNF